MTKNQRPMFQTGKHYEATPLCFEIYHALRDKGEYYFTANKFLDTFQLEDDLKLRREAVDKALTFSKRLNQLECEWANIAILMVDKQTLQFNFTYQVQSKRFDNQPLKIDRFFFFNKVPAQFMPFIYADMWVQAYDAVPWQAIKDVAAGK